MTPTVLTTKFKHCVLLTLKNGRSGLPDQSPMEKNKQVVAEEVVAKLITRPKPRSEAALRLRCRIFDDSGEASCTIFNVARKMENTRHKAMKTKSTHTTKQLGITASAATSAI